MDFFLDFVHCYRSHLCIHHVDFRTRTHLPGATMAMVHGVTSWFSILPLPGIDCIRGLLAHDDWLDCKHCNYEMALKIQILISSTGDSSTDHCQDTFEDTSVYHTCEELCISVLQSTHLAMSSPISSQSTSTNDLERYEIFFPYHGVASKNLSFE